MPTATATLHLRVAPSRKRLLQQAAAATHATTLTDYVLSSALRQAELDLLDRTSFKLKGKDWTEFNRLLDRPPKNIPALKKLAAASADVFRKST